MTYEQIKVIGCKGHNTDNFDERFVECAACLANYNDKNCDTCRSANGLMFVFE